MINKLDELSTDCVNELSGLDMKYDFVSDEYDSMLKAIELLDNEAKRIMVERDKYYLALTKISNLTWKGIVANKIRGGIAKRGLGIK